MEICFRFLMLDLLWMQERTKWRYFWNFDGIWLGRELVLNRWTIIPVVNWHFMILRTFTWCEKVWSNLWMLQVPMMTNSNGWPSSILHNGKIYLLVPYSLCRLHHLSRILHSVVKLVECVDKKATSVVVHCSDGWDRTPQLVCEISLA